MACSCDGITVVTRTSHVERGFSINNQQEQSVARRVIEDRFLHVKGVMNINITRAMVLVDKKCLADVVRFG